MTTTHKNPAHEAAAAARNGDHENAAALYTLAAIRADAQLDQAARAKSLWAKARKYEAIVEGRAR
jgi:hypothetical protein